MHLHRSQTSGTYKPAFFTLFVNASNILNDQGRIDGPNGIVFFHEYIHFLQDLFTNIGLRNIIHLVQEYSVINNEILSSQSPTFTIPYETANEQLLLNRTMSKLIMGTEDIYYDDHDFEIITVHKQAYEFDPSVPFELIAVKIIYRTTLEEDEFYLGALHFLENMAHLLERSYSLEDNAPPYPYKVIEKIVKWHFPGGDVSSKNLIAVMEDALQTYHPALYLYQLIEVFNTNHIPFTEMSVREFAKGYRVIVPHGRFSTDKVFFENAVDARKGFRVLFNHPNLRAAKNWSDHVLSNVIAMKRGGFSFRELLTQGFDQERVLKRVSSIIRKLGTPLIKDHNVLFYNPPRKEFARGMDYLLGLEAVIGLLKGKLPCSALDVCKNLPDGNDITDKHCYESPWRRADQHPRCIIGQLWIMWGFVRKEVILADPFL